MIPPGMIRLEPPRRSRKGASPPDIPVGWALPFFKSGCGRRTHRVRSGITVVRGGVNSHVALQAWCSFIGFISGSEKSATMTDRLPEAADLCPYCELKATKAGHPAAAEFPVKKQP